MLTLAPDVQQPPAMRLTLPSAGLLSTILSQGSPYIPGTLHAGAETCVWLSHDCTSHPTQQVLEDVRGSTPLECALLSSNWAAAKLLAAAGALEGWGRLCCAQQALAQEGLEPNTNSVLRGSAAHVMNARDTTGSTFGREALVGGASGSAGVGYGGSSSAPLDPAFTQLGGLPLGGYVPLGRQLETAAQLLQKAAAKLPGKWLGKWGQGLVQWVAPGDAQTRAVEEEVARMLEERKVRCLMLLMDEADLPCYDLGM